MSGQSKETALVIYLAFLAKVANLYYLILTAFKKYWPDTVAKFISGTQDTFAWQRVRAKAQHFKRFPSSLLRKVLILYKLNANLCSFTFIFLSISLLCMYSF